MAFAQVYLFTVDSNVLGRLDTQLDMIGFDGHDSHFHATTDDDGLTETPGKNQHGRLLKR